MIDPKLLYLVVLSLLLVINNNNDTDAPSYCSCTPQDVLLSAESNKKRKYIYRPVRIKELVLHLFVYQLMAYLGRRLIFSSIAYVTF